jgi:uncharacterized membrane protein YuzA (DUF378 family)
MIDKIAMLLVIIGALNWGLVGALNFNAVDKITSLVSKDNNQINNVVYIIVGIAALWVAYKKYVARR